MDANNLKKYFVYLNKPYIEGEVYKIIDLFEADLSNIKEANLYVTGFGMYDLYLNNAKVGKQLFKPGYTYYSKRVLFQCYDIKSFLKANNTLKIYVAQGWYAGRFFCENTTQNYGELPSISYVIEVTTNDNKQFILTSSLNKSAYISEYNYAGEYDGEVIDFTKDEIDTKIRDLEPFSVPNDLLIEKTLTEVKLQEEMQVKEVINHDTYTIVDFGQNFAGVISIDVTKLNKGETITIRHGEILNDDGSLYTANLRKAKATLIYTKGDNNEFYTPRFTYMGFRYIEISGVKYVDGLIKANAIYTDMERTGYFKCDNLKVNQLYNNLVWGQKSNYVEVPTDCPQRDERLGYTGDGHVFALTGSYNFNTNNFWHNFFEDLRLGQEDNIDGNVPPYLPQVGPKTVGFMTMQGWGNAVSIIPEIMYWQYNDLSFVTKYYDSIKKYVNLEINKAGKKNLWNGISLGDWLSLGKGVAWQAMNNHPVSNSFFVNDLRILSSFAKLLNYQEDYNYYSNKYLEVKNAYIKAFINKFGKVKKDYQGTYALALKHVLTDDCEIKNKVVDKFIKNVKKNGLQTGFFGTEHLLPLLCDNNEAKLAYDVLLSETCPGWMYQVNRGATTTWERWDAIKEDGKVNESKMSNDNMVSFNHYSFGSVGEFYYQYILGIKPLLPGYEKIQIKPYIDKRLGKVDGSFNSIKGLIKVSYDYVDNNRIKYNIEVPSNALIILDDNHIFEVDKGSYEYIV